MPRILVTGSRDWDDEGAVNGALWHAWDDLGRSAVEITLVHGDCPTGADKVADRVWTMCAPTQPIERHPADWETHGKRAGFLRNKQMVDLGADVCLAFLNPCAKDGCLVPSPHASHGAAHTVALAEAAGIPIRRYENPGKD